MRLPMPSGEYRGIIEPMWSRMDELLRLPFEWSGSMPAVDVEETDDGYIVTADLPGFKKGDIEVELQNNTLIMRGKKEERQGRRFLRRERSRSSTQFQRMLQLPGPIDHSGVTAKFTKGELVITLPKKESEQGFKVPLQ